MYQSAHSSHGKFMLTVHERRLAISPLYDSVSLRSDKAVEFWILQYTSFVYIYVSLSVLMYYSAIDVSICCTYNEFVERIIWRWRNENRLVRCGLFPSDWLELVRSNIVWWPSGWCICLLVLMKRRCRGSNLGIDTRWKSAVWWNT